METLNDVDEPLNPYSRLFMVCWAGAMIVVAGLRPDKQSGQITKTAPLNTRLETHTLSQPMKVLIRTGSSHL